MKNGFPIVLDPQALLVEIDDSLKPLVQSTVPTVEAWLNFEALKAGWYGDQSKVLNFTFRLVTTSAFERQMQSTGQLAWQISENRQTAHIHQSKTLNTLALLAFDDNGLSDFEATLKQIAFQVANQVAVVYGFVDIHSRGQTKS